MKKKLKNVTKSQKIKIKNDNQLGRDIEICSSNQF